MRIQKEQKWTVGHCNDVHSDPERRVPAKVPGAVQLDWARAEGYNDYTYADNFKDYLWMEDRYWSYVTILEEIELKEGQRLFWVSMGIDYEFVVRLNGLDIFKQEGMFTPVEIDLTDHWSAGSQLEVRIFPAPKREGAPVGRSQADQCCKPAVSYGWDWHPRLIPLGIWDETYLEVRGTQFIRTAEVTYQLDSRTRKVEVQVHIELNAPAENRLVWSLIDRNGDSVVHSTIPARSESVSMSAVVDDVELWWPNGQGEPVLYTSHVTLLSDEEANLDTKSAKVGFRSVQLVMHPGAWNEPSQFPKSQSNPPITLEINGRSIFGKGSNWVNPEIFPGTITRETYAPLIEMAVQANFNLLRIWGGGIVNKESFFELCDEYGIMVWQEFPLACNNYEGTPNYLRVLDQESRSIINRLRPHASVVMWCGGNELFNSWSRMTDQSHALRLLNRNCFDLDPARPYLMTSPVMGMGHGHYVFRDSAGKEVFQTMPKATNTAYTEFGCPSPASVSVLKSIIPDADLFPPRPGTSWETHHAFKALREDFWLCQEMIESYFGPAETLEELVEQGQLLQSEGYKCIYEEGRRQKPVCSMTLNWCYNEAWPTAANNSLISWPHEPKPSLYAVGASCRPILASARISKFMWLEGDCLDPELWVLNDSPEPVPAGTMEVVLIAENAEIPLLTWDYPALGLNENIAGPMIRWKLPRLDGSRLKLELRVVGRPELNSDYTLVYKSTTPKPEPKVDALNLSS